MTTGEGKFMDPSLTERLQEPLERAAACLRAANRLVALTGAGISAESGLATFRGAGGLWEGHRVEEVATPGAFRRDPALVWRFYNLRRANLRTMQPNPGHQALAALEERWTSERFTLITQNVDGLHRVSGSRNILELHGSLTRVRCTGCEYRADRGHEELGELPRCDQCGHLLRPDIVWFHEQLPDDVWLSAGRAAATSDCLLVIGTSAVVYPAASLIPLARRQGAKVIEVNLEETETSDLADVCLYGPSGQVLPALLAKL
jgi:NAD-dependent deacetylase